MIDIRTILLESALDVGLGRKYGHTGIDSVDCVTFAEAVLINSYPMINWAPLHRDLMIRDAARPWSNVEALFAEGFREVSAPEAGRFHYVQGWRSLAPLSGGHCFLWWESLAPALASKIMESTNATSDWYRPMSWAVQSAKFGAGVRLAVLEEA